MSDTLVELKDVNGEWWDLTNGDRGVSLGTSVKGLYDPSVRVVYEEPGNWPGARYLNHRILRRDLTFGVWILHDKDGDSWASRDSEWRKAWAYNKDCYLYITTPESGTRYLKLRLGESPSGSSTTEVDLETDPHGNTANKCVMTCVAGDPFWYEADVVYSAVTTLDTTFDPTPLPWPWPQEAIPTETLTITVDPSDGKGGLNPTDQAVFGKWTVPGSTLAPSEPYIPGLPWLGAPASPATIWTIPDYSFDDPEQDPDLELGNRRLRLPGLIGGLRTEEVQAVSLDGKPTGGVWDLTLNGETTVDLPYNATPGAVEAALIALGGVAFGDVSVDRAAKTDEVQVVTMTGGPTGGTFTLTFNGETTSAIDFNASQGVLRNELVALPSVGFFDVSVDADTVNEVQVVELIGEPTGGTFILTFDGQTTDPIDWDASAFQVATALRRLSNINFLDVHVTKSAGQYQPWKITFKGQYSGIDLQLLTADPSELSGGVGIDINISAETEGARVYVCTFKGSLAGFDFPTMTADDSLLTGGVSPGVAVSTAVDGSRPYLVTFTGDLAGVDIPTMTIDTSGLTGPAGLGGTVEVVREGVTASAENCVIDTDPRVEQIVSESGSQVWSRMNGVRFRHYIPPYTKSKDFEITVSGTVPDQMVTLRIPRPWSRPWGLE